EPRLPRVRRRRRQRRDQYHGSHRALALPFFGRAAPRSAGPTARSLWPRLKWARDSREPRLRVVRRVRCLRSSLAFPVAPHLLQNVFVESVHDPRLHPAPHPARVEERPVARGEDDRRRRAAAAAIRIRYLELAVEEPDIAFEVELLLDHFECEELAFLYARD